MLPEKKWLIVGDDLLYDRIPLQQEELMNPELFFEEMCKYVDGYFDEGEPKDLHNIWKSGVQTEEEIHKSIVFRLSTGWYNEIFIRDFCSMAIQIAPASLKTQQALLRQVNDEHRHGLMIEEVLNARGYDPRTYGSGEAARMFWAYVYGMASRPDNFWSIFSTVQFVNERHLANRSTLKFAEMIKDVDPEVYVLYAEKIYRDELFHTEQLPEMIITKHATTLERQNLVRLGIERGFMMANLLARETMKERAKALEN